MPGRLQFYTTPDASADPVEGMRIHNGGTVNIPNGITLGETVTSTSAANTLHDYEEGTFTMTCDNSVTLNIQTQARYVKIGQMVIVTGQFRINGDNGNSALVINNLPFTSLNTGSNDSGFSTGAIRLYQYPDPGGFGNYYTLVEKNDTKLYFLFSRASNTDASINAVSGGYISFCVNYHTAS